MYRDALLMTSEPMSMACLMGQGMSDGFITDANCVNLYLHGRRGGGIEPLHVSMPRELKSRPSTSVTHPGLEGEKKKLLSH